MARVFEAVHGRWPAIARVGLIVTGGVCLLLGALAMIATQFTEDGDIARILVAGGSALMVAGVALGLRVGQRFVTAVLTGLTGGAFAVVLADMTSTAIDAPERYVSLRWVILLAAIVIALVGFQDGFRRLAPAPMTAGAPAPAPRPRVPNARGKGRGKGNGRRSQG